MATTTVKSTYSLDVETVRELDAVARRWKVSKSEALRRAIHAAAKQPVPPPSGAIAALDRLQKTLGLTREQAMRWQKNARRERRQSARRLER
jgi:Ribbon-helix-helix protein, copG family